MQSSSSVSGDGRVIDTEQGALPTKVVDGVLVRIPEGYPNEAKCPDCRNWYPWFEQEFCCHSCGWVPPAKRWSDE